MAAMHPRAAAAAVHHKQQQQHDDLAPSSSPSLQPDAAPPGGGSSKAKRGRAGLAQESWVLFGPSRSRPAQPVLTGGDKEGAISSTREPLQSGINNSINTNDNGWEKVVNPAVAQINPIEPSTPSAINPGADDRPQTADGTHFRWGSLPSHDDSRFFDDDDDELSPVLPGTATGSALQSSIYAQVPGENENDGDTDMLSIPSSLSVASASERSTSTDARQRSPRRGTARQRHASTLTEAALEENSRLEAEREEAALTSGSEDETGAAGGAAADAEDEELLAGSPDALSAGIKPASRRRGAPLGALQPTQQRAPPLSVTSSQRSSGVKRRHRQPGMSDKGSKRSHTSGGAEGRRIASEASGKGQERRKESPFAADRKQKGAGIGLSLSWGQAARQIFSVDEEVLDMMAQPGSVFSQALPPRQRRSRALPRTHSADEKAHGFDAFSAHLASELGDSAYHRRLFTSFDETASSSGEETETERVPSSRWQTIREEEEEDAHTAALGFQQSLDSVRHFLVGSLYGSRLNSDSERLAPLDLSSTQTQRSERSYHSGTQTQGMHEQYRERQVATSYWRRLLRSLVM